MPSETEPRECDGQSHGGLEQPRTRCSPHLSADEPGIELIDLPPCAIVPSCRTGSNSEQVLSEPNGGIWFTLARFWETHVTLVADCKVSRDYLAVERTFLGYMRTSSMLALAGVVFAQLAILQQKDTGFGYSLIGKPLATCFFACAIWTVMSGALRAWRYQRALIRGYALCGGIEIHSIIFLCLALLLVLLGLTIAIDTPRLPSHVS
ncbi:hypothetical protein F5B20DRAFT_335147 [Whalleya microplaca]|nr:hypothetical protein F5B20DRAFT_335147 [Whalleya microplaca]